MMSIMSASSGLVLARASKSVLQSNGVGNTRGLKARYLIVRRPLLVGRNFVRCQQTVGSDPSCTDVQEEVDRKTKEDLTTDIILRNQDENLSEKQSVFGSVPTSGSFFPRPEIERRPETGDRSFGSLFSFDGAAPETINGRLAMVGFVWALAVEKATGLTIVEQVLGPGTFGLVNFVAVVHLFTYASIVPFMNGESTDARHWGIFNAKAERWNGRLAMLGFAALLIDEAIRGSPFISCFPN